MDKQQILQMAKQDPQFSQAVMTAEQKIGDMPVTSEGIDELVKMFEFALNHPDKYDQIRAAAVKDGYIDEQQMPPQFDKVFLVSVLVMLYGLQERTKQKGFARGGLAQAAQHMRQQGRGGDTMLAHINPREAMMLRNAGGGETTNPQTGLPEYFNLKSFLGAVLPIALSFIAPGIGTAIGSALGASAAWAPALGSAVVGAGSSALTGGNALQGALLGGLSGGLGSNVGSALAPEAGSAVQGALGSGLVGGVAGVATGDGFAKGAAKGALGQFLGSQASNLGEAGSALQQGAANAGSQFGNMMAAGYDPKTAAITGGLSGLATGMFGGESARVRPSEAAVQALQAGSGNSITSPADLGGVDPIGPAGKSTGPSDLFSMNNLAKLSLLGSALGSRGAASPEAKAAVSSLSPSQQEYFNRPSTQFDWSRIQQDANQSGLPLNQYMARNWNQIAGGAYNVPTPRPAMARGGALNMLAAGGGSGRDDTIDARLSDGEYVMDAETVAMLGDGSTKEGAKRLDAMRTNLRQHKGAALAKGRISPDAKSPLAYLKEA